MKFKSTLSLLLLIFTISCSNLSKNIVQDTNMVLRNGTFADKIWKEDLIFKKVSWYHELTLQLDIMMAYVSPQSAFNFWFSKDELESMAKCGDARVMMAYSLDTKDIPYSTLYDQLEKNGYTRFDLLEFKRHILQHPDAQQNGFRLYHIFAICKQVNDHKPLIMNFPGYTEKLIN